MTPLPPPVLRFFAGGFFVADPNNDSPLNTEAAQLWADQEKYRQVCRQKFQEGSSSESS